jgi:hypothetical protein
MATKRATWFENRLAFHLVESAIENGRSNGLIRGSSVGSKCLRKLGYMILGYEEQPQGAHSQYVLNFGNAFHDMVQGWMAHMGLVNATPYLAPDGSMQWNGDAEGTILDTEDGIIGHYDGLTRPLVPTDFSCAMDDSGKRYLLEFKTISNKSRMHAVFLHDFGTETDPDLCTIKYLVPPGKDLLSALEPLEGSPPKPLHSKGNEVYMDMVQKMGLQSGALLNVIHKPGAFTELTRPKDEHIYQATYYASRLGADAILIVYLAKDMGEDSYDTNSLWNLPVKAFEATVDKKVIDAISSKTRTLWETLERGQNERPEDPESWLPFRSMSPDDKFSDCKFCSFAYTCYPDHPKVLERLGERFEQQAMALLPVATGKPFIKHDKDSWGREAAKKGRVQDSHGQEAVLSGILADPGDSE